MFYLLTYAALKQNILKTHLIFLWVKYVFNVLFISHTALYVSDPVTLLRVLLNLFCVPVQD